MGTMETWRAALANREARCPWPGPRPMRVDEAIRGRDKEARAFINLVRNSRLVLLDGKSGVGKSSLLQASLLPALRQLGYAVAVCSDWSGSGLRLEPGADPQQAVAMMLATKIRQALAEDPVFEPGRTNTEMPGIEAFNHDLSIVRQLDEDAVVNNRRTVIVLDQFEELIRYSPASAKLIIEIVIQINHSFPRVTLVISLRSEYIHELRELDREAVGGSYAWYELKPLADERARDVIEAPNGPERIEITVEAAERLESAWREARHASISRVDTIDDVGLLHLQAALYVLHWDHANALGERAEPIGLAAVESFCTGDPLEVFETAMERAVHLKLEHCGQEASQSISRYLSVGVREYIARVAPQLSSGGFKLHREAEELCRQVLDDELDTLGASGLAWSWQRVLRQLLAGHSATREPLDLFEVSWEQIAESLLDPSDVEVLIAEAGAIQGAEARTCGVFMGCASSLVLIEELRRFAVALMWMHAAELIRLSTPSENRTMISLIHDRFGGGLERWGELVRASPEGPLHAITMPSGATLEWSDPVEGRPGNARLIPNLRWRGAFVSASFRDVVFANCDFRGTLFLACQFTGVAFLNCLLDGAIFDRCTIEGSPGAPLASYRPLPSSFLFGDDVDTTELSAAYARVSRPDRPGRDGTDVFSQAPGMHVKVGNFAQVSDRTAPTAWEAPQGGAVVYGGRVSSLVLRAVSFADAMSTFAFRYVAGSGLDIVEHKSPGTIEVFGSAVRHLTATPDRAATSDEVVPAPAPLTLNISGSAIAQMWLSAGLAGNVKVHDSKVSQVWNSEPGLGAVIDDCTYQDVVGFTLKNSSPAVPGDPVVLAAAAHVDFVERSLAMDYIRDPSIL